jgi:hypothetical protein
MMVNSCMCIVIGKYFPGTGWVALKNRDRNYVPEISFRKKTHGDVEILYFWDDITQYCEGLNSYGIGILSASLMVQDDEKEIEKRSKTPSKDGKKIKKALTYPTVKGAVASLIKDNLPGNTLVFDAEHMYLIEGSWEPGGYKDRKYDYKVREIPHDEIVVRTNHGIWLSWAGYQIDGDRSEKMSRISSLSRRLIALDVTEHAKDPEDILDGLTKDYTHDGQLNALRTSTEKKKMRTTSQIMIIPKEHTMYVRPVQSHMHFNFWEFNHPEQKTWVELLSNRVLYMNLNNDPMTGKPPFDHKLNHNTED